MNEEAKELLTKAANYMSEHGHTKGAFENNDGTVCADGALQKVCGVKFDASVIRTARALLALQIAKEDSQLNESLKNMGGKEWISEWLRAEVIQEAIWDYNDRDETTAEDVILMFKRAAERGEG